MYFLGTCFLYSFSLFNELPTRFFLVFSSSDFVSSICHYREVTPSLLTRLPRKTSKINFVLILFREPVSRTGLQRYALFSNFQTFLQKFFNLFFASIFYRTLCNPLFEWECKGTTFLFNSKFFFTPQVFKNNKFSPYTYVSF